MSSLPAEAATTAEAAVSGSNVSECLKDISDISNKYYHDLQNGQDTPSRKEQKKKKKRVRRRGRKSRAKKCDSESVTAAFDKSTSFCIDENENDDAHVELTAEYSRNAYKNIYISISGKLGATVKNVKQCIITKKVDPNSQFNLYDIIIAVNGHIYEQVIKMEGGIELWIALLRDPGVKNISIIRPWNPTNLDFSIPHHRFDCSVHPFTSSNTKNADNAKCCPNCFCLVCDEYAYKCKDWDSNISNPSVGPHCHAHEGDTKWINLVKARVKARRDAAAPTIGENGGATDRQKQQRKRRNKKRRDKNKSGEHGSGESSTVAEVVPATKNMSSATGPSPITIRISNPDFGKAIYVKVKQTTKMEKYFAGYASIKSIPSHVSLRFTFDGKDIQPDDTPEMLGLKENDVIKCSDQHALTKDTQNTNVLEKRDGIEAMILLKNTDASSIVFEDECLMSSILHFEGSWLTGNASDTIGLVCKSWNSFAIGKKGGKALAIILDEQEKKLIDLAKEVMMDESMSWSARILAMAIADNSSGLYKAFDDEYDSSQGIGAAFEEAKMYKGPVRSLEVVCPREHPFYQCCNTIQPVHRDVIECYYGDDDPDDINAWATLFAYSVAFAAAKVGSTRALSFIEDKIGGGNEDMMWKKEFDDNGSSFIRRLVAYACRFPTLKGPVASVRELFPETCCDLFFYNHETANNLHLAASRGHNDLVRTLLEVGMDPNEKCWIHTSSGLHHLQRLRTPADWAEAKGHTELAQLLRRAQGVYGEEGYGRFLHCQVGRGSVTGLTDTTFKVDW